MRALLDTRAFLWFNFRDPRLGSEALRVIADEDNEVLLSVVSAWEVAIKHARGRLPELPEPPATYVPSRASIQGFAVLPIGLTHALAAGGLPRIHADPFDRMLVAQAQVEGLAILTSDPHIGRYDVEVIW